MVERLDQHELVVSDVPFHELLEARSALQLEVLSPGAYRVQISVFGRAPPAQRLAEITARATPTVLTHVDANARFILHTTEVALLEAFVADLRE